MDKSGKKNRTEKSYFLEPKEKGQSPIKLKQLAWPNLSLGLW